MRFLASFAFSLCFACVHLLLCFLNSNQAIFLCLALREPILTNLDTGVLCAERMSGTNHC